MTPATRKAAEAIRSAIYEASGSLSDNEYLDLLETLAGDVEAMEEAKKEEMEDEE